MTPRIDSLKRHVAELNAAGVRRTTLFELVATSLRQTRGEAHAIRRAKAFAYLLDHAELLVLPHELIAGSVLGTWPVAEGLPSFDKRLTEAKQVIDRYLTGKRKGDGLGRGPASRWALISRDHYHANVSYDDLQRLIRDIQAEFAGTDELAHYEIGRELERHFNFDYGNDQKELNDFPWQVANHVHLCYGKLIQRGVPDLLSEIEQRLAGEAETDKRTFYEAALLSMQAFRRFLLRYAEAAVGAAGARDCSEARRRELGEMAATCRKIAVAKPETFREALQLVWLGHIAANLPGGSALSFGRFDQYLYPFYARDIAEGTMSRDEAMELVACSFVKVNEPHMRTVQSLCVGGTKPDGSCAVNELSHLCLEVCRETALPYPNLAARVRPDMPDAFLDEIAQTIQAGIGHPMILNDEVWIPNLDRLGYAIEDARDYYNMGCVEIMVAGKVGQWGPGTGICFPQILEQVLARPQTPVGDPVLPAAEPFASFAELLAAFDEAVVEEVGKGFLNDAGMFLAQGEKCDPFGSVLLDGCLETGRDMYNGGCPYPPIRGANTSGFGTVVDSLAAIRECVFEDRRSSLAELRDALAADFAGYERLHEALAKQTPCFGNGVPETDDLAAHVFATCCEAVDRLNQTRKGEGTFVTVFFTYTGHVSRGEVTGATPNGRRRGETLSNGIGPTQGRDTAGPTQLLHSVTRLEHRHATGGFALNMKFPRSIVSGEAGRSVLTSLLRTYIAEHGVQLQITVADAEELRDAQAHPERHGNLIVRVGGFCEYFTRLDHALQNEVILRTEMAV